MLPLPAAFAAQLPQEGRARVIVLFDGETEDRAWRAGAYEQFVREDAPEDSVYDKATE